ncbi:hypothetical protein MU582_09730 [Nocardioidaceae bacterium SCSIO 66511]|nr:hypothetical protein MU582_09730 [Nocardioidaceae bacterium SCSIO 66511]
MSQSPSGDDPVVRALDELVRSGQIPPERARAAYEGSLGRNTPPPASDPPTGTVDQPGRQLGLENAAIAIGVGLLGATVGIAATFSRETSDLDVSNFLLGVIASLALLGGAGAAYFFVKDDVRRRNLAAWPGAIGAAGAGVMLGVLLDDDPTTGYLAGAVTTLLAVVGYYLVRRGAYVVVAILGLLSIYGSLVDDIVDLGSSEGDSTALSVSAALMVFAIGVTAAGWRLPTRDLGAIFVGALTVVAYAGLLVVLTVVAAFERSFGPATSSVLGAASGSSRDADRFNDDISLTLLFAAILVVGWAACSVLTGHTGYRVLMLVMVSSVVPLAVVGLAVEHPSWWSLGAGVIGAVMLGAVGLRALGLIGDFGQRPPSRPSGGGPIDLDQPH